MVLAERNSELVRNGRRSRGPSPNGHSGSAGGGVTVVVAPGSGVGPGGAATPDTSSDDDNSIKRNGKSKTKHSEYEAETSQFTEKIRVGRDYQAICPPLVPEPDRKPDVLNDRALLVWSPTKEIPDSKLEEYISVAKEKYGYNGEQALGMLFWHKHDLERAVMDLANFTPFPDEWTVEDKVLFEQAFHFHGKSFHRIRQMLPDKSIASLVKYYYSWKKTRHRQSVMDRQEKNKASKEGSENGSDNGSNEDSDNEDKVQTVKQNISVLKRKAADGIEDVQPPELNNRINSRWTNEELLLAVECVRKHGKDFQTIAEVMGTKTEAHVRTFYVTNRRRYNLDAKIKEYEAEKEAAAAAVAAAASNASASPSTDTAKKEEIKKKETTATSTVADESDNTTSSEMTASKSTTNDDVKSCSSISTTQKETIIEIDLEASEPPAKKIILSVSNAETPRASVA